MPSIKKQNKIRKIVKHNNLQCQKHDLDPDQNVRSMTVKQKSVKMDT